VARQRAVDQAKALIGPLRPRSSALAVAERGFRTKEGPIVLRRGIIGQQRAGGD
jgi:hypothetical protein